MSALQSGATTSKTGLEAHLKPQAADRMRKLRFEIAYDGTDFNGWQVQPGLPTIQGVLEEVIGSIEGKRVHVISSGRTDAGVHALAQVAAVSIENPIPAGNFRRAVNRLLPHSIRVTAASEVDSNFHPRFHARRKTYEYRIFREEVCPPFDRRFVYHHPYPLDEAAMIQAAPLIEGTHDFTAFANEPEKDPICTLSSISINNLIAIEGSRFLYKMVRSLVGILVSVLLSLLFYVIGRFRH